MSDPGLFTSGPLFTRDYLSEGITGTAQYRAVDPTAARIALARILSGFPHGSNPDETTTEAIWTDYLTQQNLSATGRIDVPDGLLFIDTTAIAEANNHPEWKRYQFRAAIEFRHAAGITIDVCQ